MKRIYLLAIITLCNFSCKKDDAPEKDNQTECPNKVTDCIVATKVSIDGSFGTSRYFYDTKGQLTKQSYLYILNNNVKVHSVIRNTYEGDKLVMSTKDYRYPLTIQPGMPNFPHDYNSSHSYTNYTYNGNIATGITNHIDTSYGEYTKYTTKDIITYDNDGKKLEQKRYNKDNKHTQTIRWTYDKQGNMTLEEKVGINEDGDEVHPYYYEYIYNDKNQLIRYSSWNGAPKAENKYISHTDYLYNTCGERISEFYMNGHFISEYSYDYDEHGNVLNQYQGGVLINSYTYHCP